MNSKVAALNVLFVSAIVLAFSSMVSAACLNTGISFVDGLFCQDAYESTTAYQKGVGFASAQTVYLPGKAFSQVIASSNPTALYRIVEVPVRPLVVEVPVRPLVVEVPVVDDCGCFTLYLPVCGADGNTCSNSCVARCEGVAVNYDGTYKPSVYSSFVVSQ